MFAEVRVETFDTKDGTTTSTYVTAVTTKECQQASWTFFSGGVLKNLGNMGANNFAGVIRAKKKGETVTPYFYSDSIADGIDSLWFTWNSNGNEAPFGNWNVKVYVNDSMVGNITDAGAAKIAAAGPFNVFKAGKINKEGKFVIKIVNESYYDTTANYMRFVFDNLSWTTYGSAPIKETPTFEFAEASVIKKIDVIAFSNALTNTSDGTPTFESSNPAVATVAANGSVTIVGLGTTVITASVAETDTYKAAEASYTLRVVPLNFNMETFDGAANITSGSSYYITKDSVCPASTATGIVWTTYLGSIRNTMASWPAANIAACVRAKKSTEPKFGYLKSSTISGGIDSLAFDWNTNGDESTRKQNWNIVIYINGDSVGAITDKPAAKQTAGNEFRYTLGNLKKDGDFVIEIVNKDTAEADANQFRWAMDNLEWYSYEAPCENNFGIIVDNDADKYIPGEYDAVKNEVKVVAELEKDQEVALYNKCAETTFTASQEEGGYWFTVADGKWYAPAVGTYTIFIKLNPGNDVVWTAYQAPKYEVTIADVENGTLVVKAGDDVVANGDSIAANTVLTIIPTPADGFEIDSVAANGVKVNPEASAYKYTMGYEDLAIAVAFKEVCEGEFGIMVGGTEYIPGVKDEEKTQHLEYVIVAELDKDQSFVFYDNCTQISFLASQEDGSYPFTTGEGVLIAPETGTYTIYLKMYGEGNNWIWTSFAEPSGIENTAVKAEIRKAIENGHVVIYRNGVRYTLQGQKF